VSNLVPRLGFALTSLADFEDRRLAADVVGLMTSAENELSPVRYSAYEPVLTKLDRRHLDPLVDVWLNAGRTPEPPTAPRVGSLLLAGPNDGVSYQVSWGKSNVPTFPFVAGDIDIALVNSHGGLLEAWLDLIKRLAVRLNPLYGDIFNMSLRGWDTPHDLLKRLPDVQWTSIYGRPYVEMFGEAHICNAPFHRVDVLSPGLMWVQATPDIFEAVPEDVRSRIRQHLGEEAFMSGGQWRYQTGKAPDFDFSNVVLTPAS